MKRIAMLVVSLFLIAGTSALFAGGQSEKSGTTPQAQGAPAQPGAGDYGPGYGPGYGARAWGELQTITGRVSYDDWMHPTLTSGSKEYELMVPSRLAWDAGVKAGDTITVTGHLFAGTLPPWAQQGTSATPFWVTTATIGGKSYDLSLLGGRFEGRGGRGYGMMYGYGPMMGAGGYGPRAGYGPGPRMGWGLDQ